MNQYIICKMRGSVFSFLLENGKAVEIQRDEEQQDMRLGNIYIGRIKNISGTIGAAFVEITPGTICYLPLNDLVNPVYTKKGSSGKPQMGDELLVQISREAIKTKFPSVTTNLTLHGKHILLTTGKTQTSVSSKLSLAERQRLIHLVNEIEPESSERPYGWLLRTNASGIDQKTLEKDMARLRKSYKAITKEAIHKVCYNCVLSRPNPWISRLSDLYETAAEQFLTDDEAIWHEAREYLTLYQPEDLPRLSFHQDTMQPLYKKYSLEQQLDSALSEHVWLKSGGYLIIQPTEALTVIDVNSGKYEGSKKNRQKAFFKINKEAAAEAAHQIRLRNISGIILIDFINMESQEDNKELLNYLDGLLRRDPIRTVLVDMTKLSLVEITRMKKEKPLNA
ncbi:MAG: ribonuclease E/G [Clostridiales bacterium]|nr:ribonuclease E/G [Clostridiales bacterium]